jgi:hypothetical protein
MLAGTFAGLLARVTGGGTPAASLSNQDISDDRVGTAATAIYSVNADGSVTDQTSSILESWLDAGINSNFEIMATWALSGVGGPAKNTWVSLTSDRAWSISQATIGASTKSLTVKIRNASSLVVLTTATINLSVQMEAGGTG